MRYLDKLKPKNWLHAAIAIIVVVVVVSFIYNKMKQKKEESFMNQYQAFPYSINSNEYALVGQPGPSSTDYNASVVANNFD